VYWILGMLVIGQALRCWLFGLVGTAAGYSIC